MLVAAIGDQAVERGDADVGGRVPHGDGELGAFELGQHEGAIVVVDRAQIDARARPACLVQMVPQRHRIALDHLGDAMVDRLQDVIAGREAVAAGGKQPLPLGRGRV